VVVVGGAGAVLLLVDVDDVPLVVDDDEDEEDEVVLDVDDEEAEEDEDVDVDVVELLVDDVALVVVVLAPGVRHTHCGPQPPGQASSSAPSHSSNGSSRTPLPQVRGRPSGQVSSPRAAAM
jgi:hypothetical protein